MKNYKFLKNLIGNIETYNRILTKINEFLNIVLKNNENKMENINKINKLCELDINNIRNIVNSI